METSIINNSTANAELVRRGYEAFNAGDLAALGEIFHNDSTWHSPGTTSLAGDRKGKEAIFTQFGRIGTETAGTFKANLKNLAVCDDGTIVGIQRNTGERNGKKLDADCCIVFTLKDGLLVDGQEYIYDLNAWDAFWS